MRVTIDFYMTERAGDDPILSYMTQSFYPSYKQGDVIELKRDDVVEREASDLNFEGQYIIQAIRHYYSQRGVVQRGKQISEISSNSCGIKIYLKLIDNE